MTPSKDARVIDALHAMLRAASTQAESDQLRLAIVHVVANLRRRERAA